MKNKDTAKIAASGKISIYKLVDNKKELILTRNNTILANAANLIALTQSGDTSARLTNIELYLGAVLKGNGVITTRTYDVVEGSPQVTFETVFNEASFNSNVDNAKLGPSDPLTLGYFAEANFASLLKDGTHQLIIQWTITFILAG